MRIFAIFSRTLWHPRTPGGAPGARGDLGQSSPDLVEILFQIDLNHIWYSGNWSVWDQFSLTEVLKQYCQTQSCYVLVIVLHKCRHCWPNIVINKYIYLYLKKKSDFWRNKIKNARKNAIKYSKHDLFNLLGEKS